MFFELSRFGCRKSIFDAERKDATCHRLSSRKTSEANDYGGFLETSYSR